MLLSHRFGSLTTLSRASHWLTRHGFELVPPSGPSHDACRLTLNVNLPEAAAALALIDSFEHSDPEGWPSNTTRLQPSTWGLERGSHFPDESTSARSGSPIHWFSREEKSQVDPIAQSVCDYMLSRWE